MYNVDANLDAADNVMSEPSSSLQAKVKKKTVMSQNIY